MPLLLSRWRAAGAALSLLLPAGGNLFAATHAVDTVAGLRAAIAAAAPGDTITVKDGVYPVTAPIAIDRAGAGDRPITIAAATVGGAEISGAGGFELKAPAAFIVIQGFRFTHASGGESIGAGTHHVRFTRNTFLCPGQGAYLTVSGDDAEVDHNEFRDKRTLGNMISVTGRGTQVAQRLWIHHNYFHDFANAHGNGAETIRFGLSGLSMSPGHGLVESNLFVRCTGENELISNKSCANTYRYNTFLDSPGAQLTLRHGNDCVVYANFFRGLDGLRIFGDRQLIFSNYFEANTRGIDLGNGDAEIGNGDLPNGPRLTSHDRPDDAVIVFNTFVNNRRHYSMGARRHGLGATRTTFACNVIQGGGTVAHIDGPNPGAMWRGNLVWQAGALGNMPADGCTSIDPRLTPDGSGIYRPSPGSPAIAAVAEAFPKVTVDMDGQPRPAIKSIGADEPGDAPLVARLLTPVDVGPAAP